jgi:ribosomal protein S3AE
MAKVQKKKTLKTRKKLWHTIVCPDLFGEQVLGESLVDDTRLLIGKILKINLMTILGDPKSQTVNLSFKIEKIDEGKGIASVRGYHLTPSILKRVIRRGKNRVDDSFIFKTKDGLTVKVKPLIITKSKTTNSVTTEMRKQAHDYLKKTIASKTLSQCVQDLVNRKFQNHIKSLMVKLYPTATCEIRDFAIYISKKQRQEELLGKSEKKVEDKEVKEKPEKKPKKKAEKKETKEKTEKEEIVVEEKTEEVKEEKKEVKEEVKEEPKEVKQEVDSEPQKTEA